MKTITKALGIASLVLALGCNKQPAGIEQVQQTEMRQYGVNLDADINIAKAPSTITYTAKAFLPDSVKSYEWDFDNDGRIDTTVESNDTINVQKRKYEKAGTYMATVKVTDKSGNNEEDYEVALIQ